MSDMGKEATLGAGDVYVSTESQGGFNKLLYGQPQPDSGDVADQAFDLSGLNFVHPQAPSMRDLQIGDRRRPLIEEIDPTRDIEQAFMARSQNYAIDMDDRSEFWKKAGTGQLGQMGKVSTWLKGVEYKPTAKDTKPTFVHLRGSMTEGMTLRWNEIADEVTPDVVMPARQLVTRLIDGAAKLQAVKLAVESTGSTLGISGTIDQMITLNLKAAQGVMDGRAGGSLDDVYRWARGKLLLAYGERIGLGIFGGAMMASALGCAPQGLESPATSAPIIPDSSSETELHSPPIMGAGTETATPPVLLTPTAEIGQAKVDDNLPSYQLDISVTDGQADLSAVSEALAGMGYDMGDPSNTEWMQVAKNAAEMIMKQVPGAVDVDFVLEGDSWALIPVDAAGNKIWAHDANGNLLAAPVYYGSPDLSSLGVIHLDGGDLTPVYQAVPNTADAKVEMVNGMPVFLRYGFVAADGSGETYNAYVQVLDDGNWEWNQYGLQNYAEQSGIDVTNDQPFADRGIIKDVDGKLWQFDLETKSMVEMKADPAWNIISLSTNDEGKLVATTFDRKELVFDEDANQFLELEKDIPSPVDPEFIAQQDADFEARTGVDLDNPDANPQSRAFAEGLETVQNIGYRSEGGIVVFSMIKTGVGIVDIDAPAGSGIDKVVCVYGRSGVIPGETISVAVGWIDGSGNFHNLTNGVDHVNRRNVDPATQLDFFKNLSDGAVMTFDVHTFSGMTSPEQIQTTSDKLFPEQANVVREFLGGLDNQMLERMSGVRDVNGYWAAMDPEQGDPGFVVAGQFEFANQIDLK